MDISVTKTASSSTVGPGSPFAYTVSVTNNNLTQAASDVVVTETLPEGLIYQLGTAILPLGDLLFNDNTFTWNIPLLLPGQTLDLFIPVIAPLDAPQTLYNEVTASHSGIDPDLSNNQASFSVYVDSPYDRPIAIGSFEELLRNQSILLESFEDLLQEVPQTAMDNYTFITSFEDLLRRQTELYSSFESLLTTTDGTTWADDLQSVEDQEKFLNSYEDLLRREARLFSSFEAKLKASWLSLAGLPVMPGRNNSPQLEFLASFEDLLKRQVNLLKSFETLEKQLNESVSNESKVNFLASFEDLLRRQASLLSSFEDLLKDPLTLWIPLVPI